MSFLQDAYGERWFQKKEQITRELDTPSCYIAGGVLDGKTDGKWVPGHGWPGTASFIRHDRAKNAIDVIAVWPWRNEKEKKEWKDDPERNDAFIYAASIPCAGLNKKKSDGLSNHRVVSEYGGALYTLDEYRDLPSTDGVFALLTESDLHMTTRSDAEIKAAIENARAAELNATSTADRDVAREAEAVANREARINKLRTYLGVTEFGSSRFTLAPVVEKTNLFSKDPNENEENFARLLGALSQSQSRVDKMFACAVNNVNPCDA